MYVCRLHCTPLLYISAADVLHTSEKCRSSNFLKILWSWHALLFTNKCLDGQNIREQGFLPYLAYPTVPVLLCAQRKSVNMGKPKDTATCTAQEKYASYMAVPLVFASGVPDFAKNVGPHAHGCPPQSSSHGSPPTASTLYVLLGLELLIPNKAHECARPSMKG